MNFPNKRFSLFPIERLSTGAFYDGNFALSILPFEIIPSLLIEELKLSSLLKNSTIYLPMLGSETVKSLRAIKYVIIHRYPKYELDKTGKLVYEVELREKSEYLIQEAIACLRLIRPIRQFAQACGGEILNDGTLINFHLQNPLLYVNSPLNQELFGVRTSDVEDLRFYFPLFQNAMSGNFWKFRMALEMYQSGFFQHSHWKARYFLWTAALESLYTSQPQPGARSEHSGSLVAKERIKHLLGPTNPIYPPGELTTPDPDPKLTVADVMDEIYCLRNNIAHGDKTLDYYFQTPGRVLYDGSDVKKVDMLIEAISSVIRQSLLAILKNGLLDHFRDRASSETYFGGLGLTKTLLSKSVPKTGFTCP